MYKIRRSLFGRYRVYLRKAIYLDQSEAVYIWVATFKQLKDAGLWVECRSHA